MQAYAVPGQLAYQSGTSAHASGAQGQLLVKHIQIKRWRDRRCIISSASSESIAIGTLALM
jgi:hypothetical protein